MRLAGLRLALSLLTVLPVRTSTVDRSVARTAIAIAPLVGLLLGVIAAAALAGLDALGTPAPLAGILTVGVLAVLTRGLHLDGLADTADGLGSYGPRDRALAVMRDGGAGPFAVITLVVVIGAQAISLGALVSSGRWPAVVLAVVAGRAAFPLCCTKAFPAARPDGLGALVAGSQPVLVPVGWWLALAAAAALAVPGRPWLGPLAVLVAAGLVLLLAGHTRRRFGGLTGDVLGASGELAVTVVLVICTVGTA